MFPALYLWTTFGICSLIEIIAKQELDRVKKGKRVSPYTLEFLSALERTEAYAHTGNAKVLSSAVMNPLFLARGIVEHGMPTIVKGIYTLPFQGATPFAISTSSWPLTANHRRPAICSKPTHCLNYGEDHYMVDHSQQTLPPIGPVSSGGVDWH